MIWCQQTYAYKQWMFTLSAYLLVHAMFQSVNYYLIHHDPGVKWLEIDFPFLSLLLCSYCTTL